MSKEMLINVSEGEECRIALMESGKLEEFYIERTSSTSHVGNIYRGRVVNVEPSIQAAFVDFGLGRNGFLHISDLLPTYFGHKGEDVSESVGCKMARRDRPPIQRCLRRGDDIIVQIIKEGIGTKGPTLTSYLSIPGRILVMMPGMAKMGVSRKIEDEPERKRLRQILDSLEPPEDAGFIIRTAGVGKTKTEIQRDLAYLTRLWVQIKKRLQSGGGPVELYTEGDLVTRTVRDVFTTEIDRIIIDNKEVAERVRDFIKLSSPRAKDKVELHTDHLPLFHKYNIEQEIEMMYSRHVPLPSGGSLVIDQTEAIVAIDVNSGKFRDHSDAETTAFKTDMEAAEEIPRQLKLRDMGGVIICDFIDLRYDRHRRELERKLHDNFRNDRAKTKVLRMSQFGIIELTRQRMRPSVNRSIYRDCLHCRGSGLIKTPESMSLDVMRTLAIATHDQRVTRVELTVHGDVAYYLNNRKRRQLGELEHHTGKPIIISTDDKVGLDELRLELFDARDGIVTIPELLVQAPHTIQEAQLIAKQARSDRRGDRPGRPAPRPARNEVHDERLEMEDMEEAVEQREQDASAGEIISEPMRRPQARPPIPAPVLRPSQPQMPARAPAPSGRVQPSLSSRPAQQRPTPQIAMPMAKPVMPGPTSMPAGKAPEALEHHAEGDQPRGRRRGRRGRGRGRQVDEAGQLPHIQGERSIPEQEPMRRLPSRVWTQVPGDEDAPSPSEEPGRMAPAPQSARPAIPQPQRKPEPEVKPAPIAEWPEQPRLPRRPFKPVVTPVAPVIPTIPEPLAEEAVPKRGRGRKAAAKPAAVAKPKPVARKGRKAAAGNIDLSTGPTVEEARVEGSPVTRAPRVITAVVQDEPRVRIAEAQPIVKKAPGDRHLATDEPVDPESVRVVRNARDLDHVPENEER